jgi:hypothetical protein
MSAQVDEAFRRGGWRTVRALRFGSSTDAADWVRGEGWALSKG